MPDFYYSIGTTLANMTNIETTYSVIANSLQQNLISLLPPVKRRVASGGSVRNGSVNKALAFSVSSKVLLNAFVYGVWGNFATSSVSVYVTAIDETNHYSPFRVDLDRPLYAEDMESANNTWVREIQVPGFGWALQSVTKTGNATITTSERLVYADTASGTITLTLPAAAVVTANTVYSFEKTTASNTLTIDGSGSETIDGATTVDLTANRARLDIVSDGNAWSSVSA